MTVVQLMRLLAKLPAEAPVIADGCDCTNEVESVRVVKDWVVIGIGGREFGDEYYPDPPVARSGKAE